MAKLEPIVEPIVEPKQQLIETDVLQKLVDNYGEMREKTDRQTDQIEELKKQNDMLIEVADKGRTRDWLKKHDNGEIVRTLRLAVIDDKVVMGWETTKSIVTRTATGIPMNVVNMNVFIEDDKEFKKPPISKKMSCDEFFDRKDSVIAEILGRPIKVDDKGNKKELFKVKLKDGRTLEIDGSFVNC